jgi:hypothetical protein
MKIKRLPVLLLLLLALATPAWAGDSVRCTTYEEKSLGRWQTLCSDGTRGISTYNEILDRWETRVRPPRPVVKPQKDPPPKAPRR